MPTMISRIGLLLALVLSIQALAEPAIVLTGKDGFTAAQPTEPQAGMLEHFRAAPQAEVSPAWDSKQLLLFLLALAGIGGVFFWLGRRQGPPPSLAGELHQAMPMPRSGGEFRDPAKASAGERRLKHASLVDPAAALMVEELDNVEEEAEVFFLLGRMDLAIGVLRHYIESRGDAPAHAWMSLLDILHAQGLRLEFEKLALEIRNHFNIALPTWEMANARSNGMSGLEHFPHLFAKISGQWRDPQCVGYLRSLLQDNRNGERGGFHMEVFRELLFLISLLEQKE